MDMYKQKSDIILQKTEFNPNCGPFVTVQ